eukprot:7189953-Pyramimonas_sp.AAC.1
MELGRTGAPPQPFPEAPTVPPERRQSAAPKPHPLPPLRGPPLSPGFPIGGTLRERFQTGRKGREE